VGEEIAKTYLALDGMRGEERAFGAMKQFKNPGKQVDWNRE